MINRERPFAEPAAGEWQAAILKAEQNQSNLRIVGRD
jgi:hypothetical protein